MFAFAMIDPIGAVLSGRTRRTRPLGVQLSNELLLLRCGGLLMQVRAFLSVTLARLER